MSSDWLKVVYDAFSGQTLPASIRGRQKAWFLPAKRSHSATLRRSGLTGAQFGRCSKVLAVLCLVGAPAVADVLPDDRADVLYHNYSGGGITIQGPSVLVRKKVGDSLSFTGSYYEDLISSASIDVKLSASPYHETRKQEGASVDWLHGKTIYTAGYIHSREPDYSANTAYFSLSQSMFGDLTTVSLGYRRGWDDVFRDECGVAHPAGTQCPRIVNDTGFHQQADHRAYSVSLSQILTRNAILNLNFEATTDQGYLASPYRQIRYLDPTAAGKGYSLANQIYPETRTGTATSAQFKYYLKYRAAITGSYRYYNDTWGITGNTIEVDYTQPAFRHWIFDGNLRFYKQNAANFYSDLFPRANYQNFMARDRELAAFHSISVGFGASYEFHVPYAAWINKSSVNFYYNHLIIDYGDFRNALLDGDGFTVGNEPLYKLNANIIRAFVSIWF